MLHPGGLKNLPESAKTVKNLKAIAWFHRIVMNYIRMKRIEDRHNIENNKESDAP